MSAQIDALIQETQQRQTAQPNDAEPLTDLDRFLQQSDWRAALGIWLRAHQQLPKDKTQTLSVLQQAIANIDQSINEQLNALLHHPRFIALEARWRGLLMLANEASKARNVKIKVLDVDWLEITKDLEKALEFDQSQLFKKIYNEEFGTPGGEPYGILFGDYAISHKPGPGHPNDLNNLEQLSHIASAAFCPMIFAAHPSLFSLDSLDELATPIQLESIFQETEYLKWRTLRDKEDSAFIGLCLPNILLRRPYRNQASYYNGLYFKELMHSKADYCWGNAGFAFVSILIREFGTVGWFSHIRGVPRDHRGGGLVNQLVTQSFASDAPHVAVKPSTDVIITDQREKILSDLGFIPLCDAFDTPHAAFHSNQSIRNPLSAGGAEGSLASARLSVMLQHMLCACRFAHYIKVMIRDKVGSFLTAQECEAFLHQWLLKYTSGNDNLSWEMQARFPLRESAVEVKEKAGSAGQYWSVIYLRPHYQLDQLTSELKLTTELMQSTQATA